MKKAFTLVELLIVVVVLITLMSIVFRLAGIGADTEARTKTITRMQKIENCLSGYYAAFGCYPQVRLHASRNIYQNADVNLNQLDDEWNDELSGHWNSVEAACRAQPFGAAYPFPAGLESQIADIANIMRTRANSSDKQYEAYQKRKDVLDAGFDGLSENIGRFGGRETKEDSFQEIRIFKFGVMSFLLPRYLFMMQGADTLYRDNVLQWTHNNTRPFNPATGKQFPTWGNFISTSRLQDESGDIKMGYLMAIPSQAATKRWMPNFEGIVSASEDTRFFGVKIRDPEGGSSLSADNPNIPIYTPNKGSASGGGGGNQYILDGMTIYDGWGQEFYYYSPEPHQAYQLWSAGKNRKTFPPWMSLSALKNATDAKTAGEWMADDVVHLSN